MSEAAARTRIRLCGRFALELEGEDVTDRLPGGQARSALLYLLANRDHPPSRGDLVDVIWPDAPPKDPQSDLRPILSRLRKALPTASIEGRERLRLILPEPVEVDLEEAAGALAGATAAAAEDRWEAARDSAVTARELLAGGFLPGEAAEWIETRRREVEEIELEALELAARCGLELGGPGRRDAERAARELIGRARFRESGYAILMEALAGDGNPAEALRVYEDLRLTLREELGASPAAEIQALHGELLAGRAPGPTEPADPAAAARAIPLPAVLSPSERGAFVGRETELETIRSAWDRARGGARRLVLVAGQPGIGKTRLASEFAVEAHTEGTVLYASCPQEPMLPYQPIVEALRHYAQSQPPGWIGDSLGPGAADLARLIPELDHGEAAAAPASDDPETRSYMMFDAIDALAAATSSERPVLLVLDDLHWADPPTLRLLGHLLTSQRPASLLVVGTYRDAEAPAGTPLANLLADLRRTTRPDRLAVRGLGREDVASLLRFFAGSEPPDALLATVQEATDGNPFFVEEVIRHLIETGALFERDGNWATALTVEEIGVPEGVEEVVLSRLARLSERTREVLGAAAVLGREFSLERLGRMAEGDDDDLPASLEEALDAQLVIEEAAPAGESRYAFTHALVRGALYRTLSAPRRQRIHADAARAIESGPHAESDGAVAALALHFRLAGPAGDRAKAVEYSLRAGDRARELLAFDDAAGHWDGAVHLLEQDGSEPEMRARLLIALGDMMVVVGDVGRQIGYLERALALCESLGDDERAAQVHSRLGMAHALMDTIHAEFLDVDRAFSHFDAAREVLDEGEPRPARGHLEVGVATAHTYGLRVPDGIAAGTRAMEIADAIDDELLWVGAAEAYGWHRIAAGEFDEGFEAMERTFEAAGARRSPFLQWLASQMSGQLIWGLGDPSAAQSFFDRALAVPYIERSSHRQTMADGIGRCHLSRGELDEARSRLPDANPAWFSHSLKPLLDLWEGRWDEVRKLADDVLATSVGNGNRWDEQAALRIAAWVSALRGDHEEAVSLGESALEIAVEGGSAYFELWIRPDLARSLAELGRADEASAHVERSRAVLAGGEDWRGRAGLVASAGATVLGHAGRIDDASAEFARALETLERYELRLDRAEAMYEWGRALARAGDRQGAVEKLGAALADLEAAGAGQPVLDRVRRELD